MSNRIADVALVHGAGFESQGVASRYSLAQAELGARLLEDGFVDQLIVCGKGPNTSERYELSEAELMKVHITNFGVDSSRVSLEDQSANTLGNLVYGSLVAREMNAESLIGVSRPSQKPRAVIAARHVLPRAGIKLQGYKVIEEDVKASSIVREACQLPLLYVYLQTHRKDDLEDLAEGYTKFITRTKLAAVKEARYKLPSDNVTPQ